ncbi:MAG TPA: hypothetical protein VOB72_21020 [Candidatus Dormibacteraeota bacterium]|nr:hypothetical protein [Candidatus Dormibacteraeota bacterium]
MKRTETIRIAVVNHSAKITDADAAAGVAAMQKQVSEDFGPVWNVDARLEFAGKDRLRDSLPGHWGLILLDDQDQSEELGYHDLTSSGLPLATILVSHVPSGLDWTHPASHELMEMLADPTADLAVYSRPDDANHRIYAQEVCDPCAAYEDGYVVAGRQVADFVFPNWFRPAPSHPSTPAANGRFDERGLIKAPLELRPHGYVAVLDPAAFTWSILGSGSETPAPVGGDARLQRRVAARSNWRVSDMQWLP